MAIRGMVRVLTRDMGVNKLYVAAYLWGIAVALLRNWGDTVREKFVVLEFSLLLIVTYYEIVGLIRQGRRHKKLKVVWKEVQARAEHARLEGDYEGLKKHVEEMDRLLEENFGVVAEKIKFQGKGASYDRADLHSPVP